MRKLLMFAGLVGLLVTPAPAPAAAETLTTAEDAVFWEGGPISGLVLAPELCLPGMCDEFTLELDLPEDVWAQPGGLQVMIRWEHESQDLNLYVYGPDGSLAAESSAIYSMAEAVLIPNAPNGTYTIVVTAGMADQPTEYEGVAEVEYLPPVEPVRDLLPDLVSRPARNVGFHTGGYYTEEPRHPLTNGCYLEEMIEQGAQRCLRFDQTVANIGDGPFELRFRVDGVLEDQELIQRIYRSDGSYRERFADNYVFHAVHMHFHYEQFAQSHLWASNEDGEKLGTEPVRSGNKNGFCMVDVEADRFGEKGDAPRTYTPPGCLLPTEIDPATGEMSAVSGISVGWADVYNWYLADQYIEITGVPDGYYLLENVADQENTVEELNDTNNSIMVLIRICGNEAEIVGQDSRCG